METNASFDEFIACSYDFTPEAQIFARIMLGTPECSQEFILLTSTGANDIKVLLDRLVRSSDAVMSVPDELKVKDELMHTRACLPQKIDDNMAHQSTPDRTYNKELLQKTFVDLQKQNIELGEKVLTLTKQMKYMERSLNRVKMKSKKMKKELTEKKKQIHVLRSHYLDLSGDGSLIEESNSASNIHSSLDRISLSLDENNTGDELEVYTDDVLGDGNEMDEMMGRLRCVTVDHLPPPAMHSSRSNITELPDDVTKELHFIERATILGDISLSVDMLNDAHTEVDNAASFRPQRAGKKKSVSPPTPLAADVVYKFEGKNVISISKPGVQSLLSEVCNLLNFDIAEIWLHEGQTYHLNHSHVRPNSISETEYKQLLDIYSCGESATLKHELSSSLCKWAKKTGTALWITEHQTPQLAPALKYSISGVHLAVAVPVRRGGVCATILYFSLASTIMEPFAPGAEDELISASKNILREVIAWKYKYSRRSTM